jgi:DsbC/DsbD-like thiol-disulfide interchange protein
MNSTTKRVPRMVKLIGFSLSLCALALAWPSATVVAQAKKDESQVKFTASASKPDKDGRQKVTITMDINSGFYAYANPVNNEDLEPAQTVVKIAGAQKLDEMKVDYPQGKKKMTGELSYNIYEGKFDITATVKRAAGDTGPLDVTVKFSVCNVKGFCLPPEQVKLQVK